MAEGWTRELAKTRTPDLKISVSSAGLEAHGLDPRAVQAMKNSGVDISVQTSSVLTEEMLQQSDLLVTVCSHADAHCPILSTDQEKLHLPFPDPAKSTGTEAEIQTCFDNACLQIKSEVLNLLLQLEKKV